MDQRVKAAIVLGTISFIIYVIYLMTSGGENNYLNPSGNRNPANQKLMVVDQDTGEISFIQKSLQGVNAQIVADDTVILNILKNLLGDNLNNYGGYTKSGNEGVISKLLMGGSDKTNKEHTGWYYQQINDLKSRLVKLETFMDQFLGGTSNTGKQMRDALFNKIDNGQRIDLQISGTHRLCDDRGDNNLPDDSEKIFACRMSQFGDHTKRKYRMFDMKLWRV